MNASFKVRIDISDIARRLNTIREAIEGKLIHSMEMTSIAAHAYIKTLADTHFADSEFKRKFYLGLAPYGKHPSGVSTKNDMIDQTVKNLRWIKISKGLWVVELDPESAWLEEGRAETFMGDWLLRPGDKGVKRAKDGSLYRVIPMKQTEGKADAAGAKPMFAQLVRNAAKKQNISLTKIERHENGAPKVGILHKLNIKPAYPQHVAPSDFSRPRTEAESLLSGLKAHSGLFKLQGAVVTQKEKKNKLGEIMRDKQGHAQVSRSTTVFRVISSKHKLENRWMYPEVKPANFFGQAERWAEERMNKAIKALEEELSR